MDALRRVVRSLRGAHTRARREAGLSAAAVFVLRTVAAVPELSMRELTERTGTSLSAVSEVVSRLARLGLVQRGTSSLDGRRASLRVTPFGRVVAERAQEPVQERLLLALQAMPAPQRAALADAFDAWLTAVGLDAVRPRMFFERGEPTLGRVRRRGRARPAATQ